MGVKDLWQLLAPIGRRVSVESLEGKTLAIDASIWITQFIKAMRDEEGKMMKNAHLIGTLRRILRLLFHKIRPLFVFDGATPELKLRTVQSRRRGRELQEESKKVAAQRLLRAQLRQRAVEIANSTGHRTENGGSFASSFRLGGREIPLTERGTAGSDRASSEPGAVLDMAESDAEVEWVEGYEKMTAKELTEENDSDGKDEWQLPTDADELNADVLGALPPHIRKSLIEEARRKQRNVSRSNYLPVAGNPALYSQTQLSNFLNSSKLNKKFVEAQQRIEGPAQGTRIAADGSRKYQLFAVNAAKEDAAPDERWSEYSSLENNQPLLTGDEDVYWEPDAPHGTSSATAKQNIDPIEAAPWKHAPSMQSAQRGSSDGISDCAEQPGPTASADVGRVGHNGEGSGDYATAAREAPGQATERGRAFVLYDGSPDDSDDERPADGAEEARDDVMWESGTESWASDQPEVAGVARAEAEAEYDAIPAGPEGLLTPGGARPEVLDADDRQDSQHRTAVDSMSSAAIERAVHTAASMADWAGRAVRQALKVHVRGPLSPAPASSAKSNPPLAIKSNNEERANARQLSDIRSIDAHSHTVTETSTGFHMEITPGDTERERRRFNRALRDTESLTEELKDEVIQLLQTMNLPYIVAPFEAEAQCAVLEQLGLVDGVVTEDSDALLFGASTVYKNIFTDKKFVEVYLAEDAKREMGLWREDLVALAYFLGSDYTEGVIGVGIVNATEIIHAFPMHSQAVEDPPRQRGSNGIGSRGGVDEAADGPLRGLRRFRDWLQGYDFEGELFGNAPGTGGTLSGARDTHGTDDARSSAHSRLAEFTERHRSGRAKWTVPESFPDPRIARAYLRPAASYNPEPFDWKQQVDAVALKSFCSDKLGWTDQQIRATVEPVLQRYAERSTQTRIDAHFMTYHNDMRFAKISSERLKGAVTQITGKRTNVSLGGSTQSAKGKRTKGPV